MLYRIQAMTIVGFQNYMLGSNDFHVWEKDFEANTPEEAIEIAKKNNPKMVINTKYVRTVAEIEEEEAREEAEREARRKAEEDKEAQARARKLARDLEKATALNLTLEQYRAKVKLEAKIRATEREIAKLENELVDTNKKLAYYKNMLSNKLNENNGQC